MGDVHWIYEGIVITYILSLIGYFIDFVQQNRKANRIAFWLLCMVWLMQTFFLFQQVIIDKQIPIATMADSLFVYAWVLVTFSIAMNRLFDVRFIVFFINVFSFFIVLMHLAFLARTSMQQDGIQLVNEILLIHIVLAIISYGFFTIACLFSIMYRMQYRFLKEKKALKWIWRFGDLERLEYLTFRVITIGIPLLLTGIILGFVWAYTDKQEVYWFDLKTIGSILVLLVYSGYLLLRMQRRYSGKTLALYNYAAFLILLSNFFLFSAFSKFHIL
ncbi:cytochrome C assembly family protein [Ornithinibacillus contaminans]|uniref:cytochrome C assembly family protein n=1 Tax=Ornithinibacillus contaminans TaxID=694055 RepID=UPI00064DCB62|nr:cytochrome c biogenesis protein CcsA [Ornithinibacillus contaminans]